MNTWPNGTRHAMTQSRHMAWNQSHYPGTRQMCCLCDEPTGLCEEDGLFDGKGEPYCLDCYNWMAGINEADQ